MEALKTRWMAYRHKRLGYLAAAGVMLLPLLLLTLASGAVPLSLLQLFQGITATDADTADLVLWQIRIPRITGAVLGGINLAMAGVALQAVLKNPLASPTTLGISQGAAFGAALAIMITGINDPGFYSRHLNLGSGTVVSLSAFAFSLATTAVIMLMARIHAAGRETIILAGVALSSLFMAGLTTLQYFADETQLAAIVHWTFGDLSRGTWQQLALLAVVTAATSLYYFYNRFNYNTLLAGDDVSRSLGVNVEQLRLITLLTASLATAVTVSIFGILGFVGLVAPHIGRRMVGPDNRLLLPLSALLGVLLLLVADLLGRQLFASVILPAGIITSFFGAPVFLLLLFKRGYR